MGEISSTEGEKCGILPHVGRRPAFENGGIGMLIPAVLFFVGLIFLIKGGDWFVDGAVNIAHRFGVPELLIGATVVSIGTTLPEVMVSTIFHSKSL